MAQLNQSEFEQAFKDWDLTQVEQAMRDPDLNRDEDWFLTAKLPETLDGQYVGIYQCQIVANGVDPNLVAQAASTKTGAPAAKISVHFVIPRSMTVLLGK